MHCDSVLAVNAMNAAANIYICYHDGIACTYHVFLGKLVLGTCLEYLLWFQIARDCNVLNNAAVCSLNEAAIVVISCVCCLDNYYNSQ